MNLDTDAIRKRFEKAIVGIRKDGTMAMLVKTNNKLFRSIGKHVWLNIVNGETYALDDFPTLIWPGDRCEGKDSLGIVAGEFRGFSGDCSKPFRIQPIGNQAYIFDNIRPLPAAEPEEAATDDEDVRKPDADAALDEIWGIAGNQSKADLNMGRIFRICNEIRIRRVE